MSRYVQSLEAEYHYILQYGVNIFCILIAVVGPHDAGGGGMGGEDGFEMSLKAFGNLTEVTLPY